MNFSDQEYFPPRRKTRPVKVGRHTGVPLETRGALGVYDADKDVLMLYGAAKVPHYNRDAISKMLGLAAGRNPHARRACRAGTLVSRRALPQADAVVHRW